MSDRTSSAHVGSSRCSQLVNRLRESYLYTEKRPRDLLFTTIEGLVPHHRPPLILSRVIREAATIAQHAADAMGVKCANWNVASRAVVNAMLLADVFTTPHRAPVQAGIAALATRVTGVCEDFRDLTEASLILFLVQQVGDLTPCDHLALAHALFRQFDAMVPIGDLEDRVVILLASLSDRIALNESGIYFVRNSRDFAG
jgi:hypothetical protein